MFFNDNKGQGAIEYILIIGGAVLIAAVVIAVLASTGKGAKEDVNQAKQDYGAQTESLRQELLNPSTTE